jgi:guanylate kinase
MKTIVTITGPSGSGKSTLANRLVNEHGFKNVVSHTTRKPRHGEADGESYYFVSEQEFKQMLKEWKFVEHVSFNNCYYGLSTEEVDGIHSSNATPVIVVEPNGLKQISQYCKDNDIRLIPVYIGGELETLVRRILARDILGVTITPNLLDYVSKRIASVTEEIEHWPGSFPFYYSYGQYDSETEDMIVGKIVEEASGCL